MWFLRIKYFKIFFSNFSYEFLIWKTSKLVTSLWELSSENQLFKKKIDTQIWCVFLKKKLKSENQNLLWAIL
jgi:hypothetical protein